MSNYRIPYPIFDGDKLYVMKQKELWASGITAHKEAKKLALKHVTDTFDQLVINALASRETFVYEGHFTNETTWDIPRKFKSEGYSVNMIFFGLSSPELSELRVLDRVRYSSGHFVPRATIDNNFYGNLEQLNKHYRIFDSLTIVDTSEAEHKVLAIISNGVFKYATTSDKIPYWYERYLPDISNLKTL